MFRTLIFLVGFLNLFALAQAVSRTVCAPPRDGSPLTFELEPVLTGFYEPTFVTNAGDNSRRLFVTEKEGRVWIVKNGQRDPLPFLDIREKVDVEGEQGLLSLTFHPDYRHNSRFFIFYNTPGAQDKVLSVVAEYRVSRDPNRAAQQERILLAVEQLEYPIHKGGQLGFGPDGYLYVSLGDSQGGGVAQQLDSLYGTLLRIDVDKGEATYAIPPDNPFVGVKNARAEIWAYGFRNPWRFSFDACTGHLIVTDVGSSTYEEIDFVSPGKNYGWPAYEGILCQRPDGPFNCDMVQSEVPDHWYGHMTFDEDGGNGIIGGYFYRGRLHPQLQGRYIFGDTASRRVWTLAEAESSRAESSSPWRNETIARVDEPLTSFGQDQSGEIYALGYWTGTLYRLTRKAFDPSEGNLLVTPRPRTFALENFGALQEEIVARQTHAWRKGLNPASTLEFYLDKSENVALYFDMLSEPPGYRLEVALNNRVVASYEDLEQRLYFDWLMLEGKRGRNMLEFRYTKLDSAGSRLEMKTKSPAFTFRELELERLSSAR